MNSIGAAAPSLKGFILALIVVGLNLGLSICKPNLANISISFVSSCAATGPLAGLILLIERLAGEADLLISLWFDDVMLISDIDFSLFSVVV